MGDFRDDQDTGASWEQVSTGFAELGDLLRSGFNDQEDQERSSELRQAWAEFTAATHGLGQALAATVSDPEIRASTKRVLGSLVEAIESTARDIAGAAARARRQRAGDRTATDDG